MHCQIHHIFHKLQIDHYMVNYTSDIFVIMFPRILMLIYTISFYSWSMYHQQSYPLLRTYRYRSGKFQIFVSTPATPTPMITPSMYQFPTFAFIFPVTKTFLPFWKFQYIHPILFRNNISPFSSVSVGRTHLQSLINLITLFMYFYCSASITNFIV